jgi:hypothetical protein
MSAWKGTRDERERERGPEEEETREEWKETGGVKRDERNEQKEGWMAQRWRGKGVYKTACKREKREEKREQDR